MSNKLPKGWASAKLEEISVLVMGQSPPSSTYNFEKRGLPFFQGKAEFGNLYPSPEKFCSEPLKIAEPNDILISVRAPVGPTNLCFERSCIGRGLAAIRPSGIPHLYVLFFLRSLEHWFETQGTGSTFAAISKKDLERIPLPLPPLPEQHRIVAKLEKLLAKVEASQKRLAKIPILLKRFRQAVLAAACSGRLTADWRQSNKASVEHLIDELTPRRSKGSRNSAARSDLNLSKLPVSWTWTNLRFLMSPEEAFCYGVVQPGENDPEGVFLVRAGDLQNGAINMDELRRIPKAVHQAYQRSQLLGGELLITVVGAGIGEIAIAPPKASGMNIARAIAKVPVREVEARYVFHWLCTSQANEWMKRDSREVARPTLNLEQLQTLPVPLPPLAEQAEIVRRVEQLFTLADQLEARYTKAKAHFDKLTHSILAKAFRGELVPQDPADEPAEKLLERIRAQKAATTPAPTKRKPKSPRLRKAA